LSGAIMPCTQGNCIEMPMTMLSGATGSIRL
jgi:hypothetical protein